MPSTRPLVLLLGFGFAALEAPALAEPHADQATATRGDPRAEPTNPEARAHFEQGAKLWGLKDFEGAIVEYKKGARIEGLPVFDLALGQCYRMLRQYDDALWYFNRFIKQGRPSGKLLKGVEDLMAQMRAEQKATVQEPARAVPVSSIEHVAVAPASSPSVPSMSPPAATPSSVATTVERTPPWYRDALGLTLVGLGTIAASTAGYLALDGKRLRDESNRDPFQARRNELYDQSVSRYTLGAGFGIAGGGLLIVGIIRIASRSDHPRASMTSWNLDVTGSGLRISGQF
ncbi:MAG: tetratricopeptide repeat protein [Deltaproteobacteria bacterium]|nr:MAG: tetratricopeptide repeat protein [Deltaproteobacteria bacterium]